MESMRTKATNEEVLKVTVVLTLHVAPEAEVTREDLEELLRGVFAPPPSRVRAPYVVTDVAVGPLRLEPRAVLFIQRTGHLEHEVRDLEDWFGGESRVSKTSLLEFVLQPLVEHGEAAFASATYRVGDASAFRRALALYLDQLEKRGAQTPALRQAITRTGGLCLAVMKKAGEASPWDEARLGR